MGVSSCTGPIGRKVLQTVMLGGDWEWLGSLLVHSKVEFVSLLRHLVCEEYKHSASVQSLLINPKTG